MGHCQSSARKGGELTGVNFDGRSKRCWHWEAQHRATHRVEVELVAGVEALTNDEEAERRWEVVAPVDSGCD